MKIRFRIAVVSLWVAVIAIACLAFTVGSILLTTKSQVLMAAGAGMVAALAVLTTVVRNTLALNRAGRAGSPRGSWLETDVMGIWSPAFSAAAIGVAGAAALFAIRPADMVFGYAALAVTVLVTANGLRPLLGARAGVRER